MERKEAIEVVKKNYPHVTESGSQFETALGTLIPELKESEDERIRKELISFVRGMLACHDKPNAERDEKYESWIVWLEKRWSKEDYNMLNRLIGVLEQTNKEDYHEAWEETFLPWLKSLKFQPHYKPDEYQLRALNEIVNYCGNSPSMHFNDYLYNVLKHLLDDLKNCKTS